MRLPIDISYRGVEKTDEVDNLIRAKAARLDRFCDHISRCDVAVERPNHAQHSGNPFRVRVDVTYRPGMNSWWMRSRPSTRCTSR